MVTSAEGLAQAAAQGGYHVLTYSTFPSQIMGGPTWAQARIATTPILSNGDALDVLVCFNKEAYEEHNHEVRDEGVIIYNSGAFKLEDDPRAVGLPFSELARSTGNARAENMVVIGAFAHLVNMPQEYLEAFVRRRFTRGRPGDDEIIRSNIEAMGLGRDRVAESGLSIGELADPVPPPGGAGPGEGQRGHSPRGPGRRAGFLHRLPHLARHHHPRLHGAEPGRAREVRLPGKLGDRVDHRRHGRGLRRQEGDDLHRGPRLLPDERGPGHGVDGRNPRRRHRRAARRTRHGPADQDRAVRPLRRHPPRPRRRQPPGYCARHGGGVLLRPQSTP